MTFYRNHTLNSPSLLIAEIQPKSAAISLCYNQNESSEIRKQQKGKRNRILSTVFYLKKLLNGTLLHKSKMGGLKRGHNMGYLQKKVVQKLFELREKHHHQPKKCPWTIWANGALVFCTHCKSLANEHIKRNHMPKKIKVKPAL